MARLKLEVHISDWCVEDLQKAVAAIDELDSPGSGISAESVKATDILTYILNGEIGALLNTVSEDMVDDD